MLSDIWVPLQQLQFYVHLQSYSDCTDIQQCSHSNREKVLTQKIGCRGTYIDSVTVIFLVISLGLAVDYSVHVAHGYLASCESDPKLRLQKTMAV